MTLDKIKKLEKEFELNKNLFPSRPDFDSMTEAELDRHIKMMLEQSHREGGIFSLEQALERLHWEYVQGLISEKEYELMKDGEIEYWNKVKEAHNA